MIPAAFIAQWVERSRFGAQPAVAAVTPIAIPRNSIGQAALAADLQVPLSEMPGKRREDWIDWLNQPQTVAEPASGEALTRILSMEPIGGSRGRWSASAGVSRESQVDLRTNAETASQKTGGRPAAVPICFPRTATAARRPRKKSTKELDLSR